MLMDFIRSIISDTNIPTSPAVAKNTAIQLKFSPSLVVKIESAYTKITIAAISIEKEGRYLIIFFLVRKCISIVIIIFITTIIGKIFSFEEYSDIKLIIPVIVAPL